jgi:putative PIN family toxin of toxin-antitoxin system
MIPAVFDCMTFLQGVTNRKGPAGACLALVDEKHVKLFVSADILEEIRDVLHRPKIRKSFPTLTDEVVQDFLDHVVETAHAVENVPSAYKLGRDPDDERYLNLAIATQATFLVSRDNDLLDLMKDDAFRKAYSDLAIVDPPTFATHVRSEIAKTTGST